jgi:hypothetical protein
LYHLLLNLTEQRFRYVTSYFFVVTSNDFVTFKIAVTSYCKITVTVDNV